MFDRFRQAKQRHRWGDEVYVDAPSGVDPLDEVVFGRADDLSWLSISVIEPFDLDVSGAPTTGQWWRSVGDQLIAAAYQHSAVDYDVALREWV